MSFLNVTLKIVFFFCDPTENHLPEQQRLSFYRKAYEDNHPVPKRFHHWDSRYKHDLHPNRFVQGTDPSVNKPDIKWWDTKNAQPASASEVLIHDVMRQEYLNDLDNAR